MISVDFQGTIPLQLGLQNYNYFLTYANDHSRLYKFIRLYVRMNTTELVIMQKILFLQICFRRLRKILNLPKNPTAKQLQVAQWMRSGDWNPVC